MDSERGATLIFALLVLLSTQGAGIASADSCPRFAAASEGLPTESEWRTHPTFGDVNGDGHLDLVGHPRKGERPGVWLGDGRGAWTSSNEGLVFPGFPCGVGTDLADVNGDGFLDLGIADHCSGLFVYLGDGEGRWRLAPLVDPVEKSGREDLVFGDVDGDGHVDLVAIGTGRGGIQLYRGDGKGGWKRETRGLPERGRGKAVALGDVNGDGRLDLLASYNDFPAASSILWIQDKEGNFNASGGGLPELGKLRVVDFAGDIDRDGNIDLVATSIFELGRPPLLVYLNQGDGTWQPAVEGLPGPVEKSAPDAFHGVSVRDFDGDGHLDLVAVDWGKAGIRLWLGEETGTWTECSDTGLPSPPAEHQGLYGYGLEARDVNRDGKLDLAFGVGRAPKGSIQVWIQE